MPRYRKIQSNKNNGGQADKFSQCLQKFNSKIGVYGLYVKNVEADGNCLFRAISDQINGDEEKHIAYRATAVAQIIQNKDHYQKFLSEDVDQYISSMKRSGTWGGHLELQAVSEALQVTIIVHELNRISVIGDLSEIKKLTKQISCFKIFYQRLKDVLVKFKVLKFEAQVGKFRQINIGYHQGPNILEHYTSIRNKTQSTIPMELIQIMMLENKQFKQF